MTSSSHNVNSLCIVANGPSVLKEKLGKAIDSFTSVARINNYTVKGFEEYTGTRTDIWFNGSNSKLKKPDPQPGRCIVLIPSAILRKKGDRIHKRIQKRTGRAGNSYEVVEINEIQEMERSCSSQRVTTGTMAILWAMTRFSKVYIHGFDFFISNKTHYNDTAFTRTLINTGIIKKADKHNTSQEKRVIESFVSEERIRVLSDMKGNK
ncbi:MAG: glycosyltransferase family 29 protein [Chitinivibrionales bacterium]